MTTIPAIEEAADLVARNARMLSRMRAVVTIDWEGRLRITAYEDGQSTPEDICGAISHLWQPHHTPGELIYECVEFPVTLVVKKQAMQRVAIKDEQLFQQ